MFMSDFKPTIEAVEARIGECGKPIAHFLREIRSKSFPNGIPQSTWTGWKRDSIPNAVKWNEVIQAVERLEAAE